MSARVDFVELFGPPVDCFLNHGALNHAAEWPALHSIARNVPVSCAHWHRAEGSAAYRPGKADDTLLCSEPILLQQRVTVFLDKFPKNGRFRLGCLQLLPPILSRFLELRRCRR